MNSSDLVIFIVGVGATVNLYKDYLEDLAKRLPNKKIVAIEWWNQSDYGQGELDAYLSQSNVILIGHSGGGAIALQAFEKWPDNINKIILLDSHFLRSKNTLPPLSKIIDVMIEQDDEEVKRRVRAAYAPALKDETQVMHAFAYAIDWVNHRFDNVCLKLKGFPSHSVLSIGMTNKSFCILKPGEKEELTEFWTKFNVDSQFTSIRHFDLIVPQYAVIVNQSIVSWL